MWTLKMHAPGICLLERGRTCEAQDAQSFALFRAFFRALLRRDFSKTALESTNREKNF
jgi:hypothetical protein